MNSQDTTGDKLVAYAQSEVGVWPYSWGGGDNNGATYGIVEDEYPYCNDTLVIGFDCSGLSKYSVYQATGISLIHNAQHQFNDPRGVHVPISEALPGDLFFYGTDSSSDAIYHVTIFAGEEIMVEAPGHYDNCTGILVCDSTVRASSLVQEAVRFW